MPISPGVAGSTMYAASDDSAKPGTSRRPENVTGIANAVEYKQDAKNPWQLP